MVNLSLYRAAFAPALIALVAMMFSLQGIPDPLEPTVPPASFDAGRAAATARQIVTDAPQRTPGSDGDEAAADLVAERFADIPSGSVSEQTFETSFDGDDVEARNVLLTLPGDERTIRYIEDNPLKIGWPRQEWAFVKAYDGWNPERSW